MFVPAAEHLVRPVELGCDDPFDQQGPACRVVGREIPLEEELVLAAAAVLASVADFFETVRDGCVIG